MTALLSVQALDVSFTSPRGPVQVLRRVSLEVQPGRIVGDYGESRSGKS
jgi:ABC-type glutathione transport system ATPase component